MTRRKRSDPNRPGWAAQLEVLKADVKVMPPGSSRDAADRRAKQLEVAIDMQNCLTVGASRLSESVQTSLSAFVRERTMK